MGAPEAIIMLARQQPDRTDLAALPGQLAQLQGLALVGGDSTTEIGSSDTRKRKLPVVALGESAAQLTNLGVQTLTGYGSDLVRQAVLQLESRR
jgi:hypothetical protein